MGQRLMGTKLHFAGSYTLFSDHEEDRDGGYYPDDGFQEEL